jgi:hypothetical protein
VLVVVIKACKSMRIGRFLLQRLKIKAQRMDAEATLSAIASA